MADQRPRTATEVGITVEPNPHRVVVTLDGRVIADTRRALVMRAPDTPPVQYIPREDVDMARLTRTALVTHCPYKGDCVYWSIDSGRRTVDNAVWSYETPRDEVAPIREHLAFYADRVDAIEERP